MGYALVPKKTPKGRPEGSGCGLCFSFDKLKLGILKFQLNPNHFWYTLQMQILDLFKLASAKKGWDPGTCSKQAPRRF